MAQLVTALFQDSRDAERAVNWLLTSGVPAEAVTVVSRDETQSSGGPAGEGGIPEPGVDAPSDGGRAVLTGAGAGAGAGLLFGLAAAAIPGAGPFLAAGAWATSLGSAGAAAASGAVIGAATGGLAGALAGAGLDSDESDYYAREIERGATLVSVDSAQTTLPPQVLQEELERLKGRPYARAA